MRFEFVRRTEIPTGDLYIVKVPELLHGDLLSLCLKSLHSFNNASHDCLAFSIGSNIKVNDSLTERIIQPDVSIRPKKRTKGGNKEIIGIIDTEVFYRSTPEDRVQTHHLFQLLPNLRFVVSIRIYDRRPNERGLYAALATLTLKDDSAGPRVVDTISFGSSSVQANAAASLTRSGEHVRHLHLMNDSADGTNPWIEEQRPYIEVSAADMLLLPGNPLVLIPGAPHQAGPWKLDLWDLRCAIDSFPDFHQA